MSVGGDCGRELVNTHTQNSQYTLKEVAKGHVLTQRCNRMHSLTQLHPNSLKRANVLIIILVLAGTSLLDHLCGGHTTFNGRLSLHPEHMAIIFIFYYNYGAVWFTGPPASKEVAALFIFPSLADPQRFCRPKRHRGGRCSTALDLKLPALWDTKVSRATNGRKWATGSFFVQSECIEAKKNKKCDFMNAMVRETGTFPQIQHAWVTFQKSRAKYICSSLTLCCKWEQLLKIALILMRSQNADDKPFVKCSTLLQR